MTSVLTQQQLALLGVAAHKLYSQPFALAAYFVLLERAAEAGGEAVTVTASGLGGAINIGGKAANSALRYLEEKGFISISQKRTTSNRLISIAIVGINEEKAGMTDTVTNIVTNPVTNLVTNVVKLKKEKETKEAVSPQTPFPLERKEKKKERASRSSFEKEKKKNNNKTDFSNSKEKERPTPDPALRRKWGLAPLCGAGDTFSVSSSTPVARNGGEASGKGTDLSAACPRAQAELTAQPTPSLTGGMSEGQGGSCGSSVDDRRNAFWQQLQPYVPLYGEDSVKSFFNHWRRCNKNTGIMMFEDDEYFEIEVYLDEWHRTRKHKFSQRRGYRGGGGGGAGETAAVSRGSVAEERAAEQARQRERIREQSAEQQAESELERLEKQLDYVPPEIISYLKGKGLQPSAMQPDEILTIIKPDELSWDQTRVLEQWQAQRRNVINTIARL